MIASPAIRRSLGAAFAAIVLACTLTAFAPRSEAAFVAGQVTVDGYKWTGAPVDVNLNDISASNNGQIVYTIKEILKEAEPSANGDFSLATVPGIEILKPGLGNPNPATCTGDEIRAESSSCPTFRFNSDTTYMRMPNGTDYKYTSVSGNPLIYITKPQDLKVTISPRQKAIKSGESVTFTADVSNESGSVTFTWDFNDGSGKKTTSSNQISHVFTGSDKTFNVVVTATSTGNFSSDEDFAVITTGKIKKQKKPKDNNKNDGNGGGGGSNNSTPYVPGYTDYGTGGSTGTGTPSTGSTSNGNPQQEKQKKDQTQPADNGLQTVSGELIDPGSTATVLPPSDSTDPGTQEANPADGSGGGGIPDGAKAAIGIGALLGLGGLAEAGGFAGAFRRFRP